MRKTPSDSVSDWRELAREPAGDYRIFSVERSVALSPVDGKARTFHRILAQTWTQIIPITSDDQVVMIRQYRHGAQRVAPADVVLRAMAIFRIAENRMADGFGVGAQLMGAAGQRLHRQPGAGRTLQRRAARAPAGAGGRRLPTRRGPVPQAAGADRRAGSAGGGPEGHQPGRERAPRHTMADARPSP